MRTRKQAKAKRKYQRPTLTKLGNVRTVTMLAAVKTFVHSMCKKHEAS